MEFLFFVVIVDEGNFEFFKTSFNKGKLRYTSVWLGFVRTYVFFLKALVSVINEKYFKFKE